MGEIREYLRAEGKDSILGDKAKGEPEKRERFLS